MKIIDREALIEKLQSEYAPVLVEALPEKYYRDWHLPNARHLPHDKVLNHAIKVLPDKSIPIVVYCASRTCQNSHTAAALLESLGYADVSVYPGGKEDWSEAGLPVERESTTA
jgi:rhodanese-related sulfurtransferase